VKFRKAIDALVVALAIDAGVSSLTAILRRLPAAAGKSAPQKVTESARTAGAGATTPSEIPMRGWKQIGKRVFNQIGEDRVMAEAASVTYYSLLAIFPAIAALISLYGLIADPATISKHLDTIAGVVPGGGVQIITDQINALTAAPKQGLGLGAVVGILISIWSANAGVKSLFDALNVVYEERETRSFFHRTWLSLAFTLGALVFVILALTAVVAVPAILTYVGLGTAGDLLLSVGRWPLLLFAIMLFLALTYRYGPSRKKAKWRWVSWGSAFAGIFWLVGSAGFSYYAAHFGNYNKTYGSLGAAVGFMTWIWISTIIVLIGAELNAEMEHQTARDSTVGEDKPIGRRGAVRADKVAAA
jgi:membrane protein